MQSDDKFASTPEARAGADSARQLCTELACWVEQANFAFAFRGSPSSFAFRGSPAAACSLRRAAAAAASHGLEEHAYAAVLAKTPPGRRGEPPLEQKLRLWVGGRHLSEKNAKMPPTGLEPVTSGLLILDIMNPALCRLSYRGGQCRRKDDAAI